MWTNGSYKATLSLDPGSWQWKKGLVFWVTLHVTWGGACHMGAWPVTWGGACHMGWGLSHGGMACHMGRGLLPIKNFMITFYIQDSSLDCWFAKVVKVAKSIVTAGKKQQGKSIWFKIQSLTSCTYTHVYVCCIQISHFSLESNPCQCDKNSCLKKHSTLLSTWAHEYGSGHETRNLGARLADMTNVTSHTFSATGCAHFHPSQLMQLPGPPPPSHKCKPHSDCTTAATRNTRTPNPTQLPSAISSPKVRLDRKWTRPEVVIILQTTEVIVLQLACIEVVSRSQTLLESLATRD